MPARSAIPASVPPTQTPLAAAAAETLRGLIAGRLVTHEVLGDPARLTGEAATLRAICRLVSGSIYRLAPYHYAFSTAGQAHGGDLAGLGPAAQAQALAAALAAPLGAGAVRITPIDPPATEASLAPVRRPEPVPAPAPVETRALLDLLGPLEAKLGALEAALAERDPEGALARFTARLEAATAAQSRETAAIDGRLSALEIPFDRLADDVAQLTATRAVAETALAARLEALDARLCACEGAARDGAGADQGIAARLARLEGSLPRFTMAQALMMEALERQAAPAALWPLPETAPRPETPAPRLATVAEAAPAEWPASETPPPPVPETEEDTFWRLPRVVSVHKM